MIRAQSLRAAVLASMVLSASSLPSFGQNARSGRTISEVYQRSGWEIPGLAGSVAITARGELPKLKGIFAIPLRPGKIESTFIYYLNSPAHEGRLEIKEEPINVIRLVRFDSGGRVFAYSVQFERQRIADGKRVVAGAITEVMYYDLDGSGNFSLRKDSKVVPDFVPEWVTSPMKRDSRP